VKWRLYMKMMHGGDIRPCSLRHCTLACCVVRSRTVRSAQLKLKLLSHLLLGRAGGEIAPPPELWEISGTGTGRHQSKPLFLSPLHNLQVNKQDNVIRRLALVFVAKTVSIYQPQQVYDNYRSQYPSGSHQHPTPLAKSPSFPTSQ